jgi:hypothetical protein
MGPAGRSGLCPDANYIIRESHPLLPPMRSTGLLLVGTAAFLGHAPLVWADGPYTSVVSSVTWQDNVTNAPAGDGVLSDTDIETRADLTWIRSVDFSTILSMSLATDVDLSTGYSGLDHVSLGPRMELMHKFALGPLAPAAYVGLEGEAVGFTDPERSNIAGALIFGFRQRPAENLDFSIDGRLGSYDARDIVFTGSYLSLDSSLKWDLDETWRFRVSLGWRDGDGVADYTAVQSPFGWIPNDAGAFNLPGAWHYVATFHDPFVAYKVSARTWSYGAGVEPAIGPHTSLALCYTRLDSQAGARYVDNMVSLSIVHHF